MTATEITLSILLIVVPMLTFIMGGAVVRFNLTTTLLDEKALHAEACAARRCGDIGHCLCSVRMEIIP
jgi:hypothetical protein